VIIAVQSAFTQARLQILAAKIQLSQLQTQAAVIRANMDNVRADINTKLANGQISQTLATAMLTLCDDVQNALLTFIDNVSNSFIKCLESILTYLAGVVCFGCDTNWRNYTVIYNNNTIVLVINTATCTAMNGGCIDFYLSFVQLIVDLGNAALNFEKNIGINSGVQLSPWNNPCHSNNTADKDNVCKDYICQQLLQGANTNNPNLGSRGVNGAEHNLGKDVRMIRESLVHTMSHMEEHLGSGYASVLVDRVMSIVEVAHSAHVETQNVLRQTSTTQSTQLSNNGVDLYAMGTQSGLDKSASSGSALTVATFLFGVIAVLAMVF